MLKDFFSAEEKDEILDNQIVAVAQRMDDIGVSSDEYPKMLEHLKKLYEIKANKRRDPVSRDTMALIAGNLVGIFVIVAYERTHVTASKGFNQLIRPK